jgi:hypothetical protein
MIKKDSIRKDNSYSDILRPLCLQFFEGEHIFLSKSIKHLKFIMTKIIKIVKLF